MLAVCSTLSWILAAISPFVLYMAVTRARIEQAALLLFAFALLRALPVFVAAKPEQRFAALRLPLVAVVSAGVGLALRSPRALLVLPSASQLAFGGVFLASLRTTPLVEHFARMQEPLLTPEKRRYCRTVTSVWGLVLVSAALVGFALAAWGSLEAWTVFTGVGSYVLVAVVFAGEYVIRRIRFRNYTRMPVDRVLRRLFPPRAVVRDITLDPTSDTVDVPREYVFFKGHFDQFALLPAVVQLSEIVVPLARLRYPELGPLLGLRRLRFRRPILPGDQVRVALERDGTTNVRFSLRVGNDAVSSGSMTFGSVPSGDA
ncbi:MAG TPA: hypothetical protein VM580_09915 [Labilithrix sp.]|nr:hypothetical protein [Labilithrix sp.]